MLWRLDGSSCKKHQLGAASTRIDIHIHTGVHIYTSTHAHIQNRGDDQLRDVAITQFIDLPYSYGQDGRNMSGGLLYFLDTSGHDPVQLEWSMKLWWVHCEGMIACLMAYHTTREKRHWDNFKQLCEYTFNMVHKYLICLQMCVCMYYVLVREIDALSYLSFQTPKVMSGLVI